MPERDSKKLWVSGPNLWRVGFTIRALPAIKWLSGLVEICDIFCSDRDVFLLIKNLDQSNILFNEGFLRGTPVSKFRMSDQPIMVSALGVVMGQLN